MIKIKFSNTANEHFFFLRVYREAKKSHKQSSINEEWTAKEKEKI